MMREIGKMLGNLQIENTRLKEKLLKIEEFVQKEIDYFGHDIEYQYDWIELMKLIKTNEAENENNT